MNRQCHYCPCFTFVSAVLITTLTIGIGIRPTLAFEKARSADQFVDSIGINTHFSYQDTPGVPYSDYLTTKKILTDIGFRHIRDGSDIHRSSTKLGMQDTYRNLYTATGIKTTFATQPNYGATVGDLLKAIDHITPAALDAIEGPNEPDNTAIGGMGNAAAVKWMNEIYLAIKRSHSVSVQQIPVIGPSPIYGYGSLAPLNSFDYENMHSYPGSGMPSGSLYDGTHPGNISSANQIVGNGKPAKPLYVTETGYEIGSQGNGVSEKAAGKYTPRLFTEYFNAGIPRTMLYQLFQSGEVSHGLVVADTRGNHIDSYHYRPAATALKDLITTLQESGTSIASRQQKGVNFIPGWLDYTLAGPVQKAEFDNGSNIHHLLLQKSNGDFYLLLWNEVSIWDAGKDVSHPAIPTTLLLKTAILSATVYTQKEDGSYAVTTPRIIGSTGGQSIQVSVPDSMLIVKVSPVGGLLSTQKNTPHLQTLQKINLSDSVTSSLLNVEALGISHLKVSDFWQLLLLSYPANLGMEVCLSFNLFRLDLLPHIVAAINPVLHVIYQNRSYGTNTYNITGLRFNRYYGGDAYELRLHSVENSSALGRFHTYINGIPALTNGLSTGDIKGFWSFANSNRQIILQLLNGTADLPKIKAIEVLSDGSTTDTDNLDNWNKTYSHTNNWNLNSVKDGVGKVVDSSTAVKASDNTTAGIVWKYSGLKDFYAYAYDFWNGTWDSPQFLQFYASKDGFHWTPVLVECHRVSDFAGQVYNTAIIQYELTPVALLPSGTNYLKYEIKSGTKSSGGFGLGYMTFTYGK